MRTEPNAPPWSRSLLAAVVAGLAAISAGCGYTARTLPTPAAEAPTLYPHMITCAAKRSLLATQNPQGLFVTADPVTTVSFVVIGGAFHMRTVVAGGKKEDVPARIAAGDAIGEEVYRCALRHRQREGDNRR